MFVSARRGWCPPLRSCIIRWSCVVVEHVLMISAGVEIFFVIAVSCFSSSRRAMKKSKNRDFFYRSRPIFIVRDPLMSFFIFRSPTRFVFVHLKKELVVVAASVEVSCPSLFNNLNLQNAKSDPFFQVEGDHSKYDPQHKYVSHFNF